MLIQSEHYMISISAVYQLPVIIPPGPLNGYHIIEQAHIIKIKEVSAFLKDTYRRIMYLLIKYHYM